MYDIIYISQNNFDADNNFRLLKSRFPFIKKVSECDDLSQTYITAAKKCFTKMFWVVCSDINIRSDFDFSYIPDEYSSDLVHVFKNGEYYDGVCLIPKHNLPTAREFEYRFFTEKKEVDIQASIPKLYDIVFISYNEPSAEKNWNCLKSRFPDTKRVSGVKGIHQAHIEAAKLVSTDMFWVVDADAKIDKSFLFNYQVPRWEKDTVHVWRSKNPVNDLIYGYGGVKLLPRKLTLNMDTSKPDMTTSISSKFKAVQQLSNTTAFNTDSFSAWRSGFRECAKLASRVIDRQKNNETQERLDVWCTVGEDKPFGSDAIQGAIAGRRFGEENKNNPQELKKINDFEWLKAQYDNLAR
jgi:hypothetical protein